MKTKHALKNVFTVLIIGFLVPCITAAAAQEGDKPNIVLINMDNFGYGELGCYGGGITRGAPTPRIDKLAREGLRLTNFNVEAQCTFQLPTASCHLHQLNIRRFRIRRKVMLL